MVYISTGVDRKKSITGFNKGGNILECFQMIRIGSPVSYPA